MVTLNELYITAEKEEIKVDNLQFTNELLGLYTHLENCPPIISMNYGAMQTTQEEKCVLAEEIGHHFTCCRTRIPPKTHLDKLNISRNEYKANKWAFEHLVPLYKLRQTINNGTTEIWELAEHFDVPCMFIHKAICYYTGKYPQYIGKIDL